LVNKYLAAKKTKEEMIKFIMRKCFKFIKAKAKDNKQRALEKYMKNILFSDNNNNNEENVDNYDFMPFK